MKNATSPNEMRKFQTLIAYFKKYGCDYGFDYLMLAAQGYQESGLDQSLRSPGGDIGIMQVDPRLAAAPPISVPNVVTAEFNIEAAVKMLHNIEQKYFDDPKISRLDKTLMTFAATTPGPTASHGFGSKRKNKAWIPMCGSAMSSWWSRKTSGR